MSDDLVISGKKVDGPENYVIEIEKSQVNGLLSEFDNDVPLLCSYLCLKDKRMVLVNPVSNSTF